MDLTLTITENPSLSAETLRRFAAKASSLGLSADELAANVINREVGVAPPHRPKKSSRKSKSKKVAA
jgi:hypothetical protein